MGDMGDNLPVFNANVIRGDDRRYKRGAKRFFDASGQPSSRNDRNQRTFECWLAYKSGMRKCLQNSTALDEFKSAMAHIASNIPRSKLTKFHGLPTDVYRQIALQVTGQSRLPRGVSKVGIKNTALAQMRRLMTLSAMRVLPRCLFPHGKRVWQLSVNGQISM